MNSIPVLRFAFLMLALTFASVAAAQTPTDSGKTPAVRPPHHHLGPPPRAGGRPGDPLPNLTAAQLTDFSNGPR